MEQNITNIISEIYSPEQCEIIGISEVKNDDLINNLPITKTKNSYMIKNTDGQVLSVVKHYDYKQKDFDWVLLADMETKPEYMGKGLASKLINAIYADVTKNTNKGLYLFVRDNNDNAIRLYKHLGFSVIKKYTLEDKLDYIIMAKGNADKAQFKEMKFK